MKTISMTPTKELNVSQLSDLALATKEIANFPTPSAIKTPLPLTESTNDPNDVETMADANNQSTGTLKSDTWFPVTVNLPDSGTPAASTPAPMTEEEKRKRAIIVASILLLLLIVLVAFVSLRKKA
jgi:hypothetical protein